MVNGSNYVRGGAVACETDEPLFCFVTSDLYGRSWDLPTEKLIHC